MILLFAIFVILCVITFVLATLVNAVESAARALWALHEQGRKK